MRTLSLFLFLLVAVPAVRADDASKTAKVEEFFRISGTEKMISQSMTMSMDQMKSGMFQQMMGMKLTPEQGVIVEELQGRVGKIVANALAWDQIKPGYVKIFAEAYTEPELDDILMF